MPIGCALLTLWSVFHASELRPRTFFAVLEKIGRCSYAIYLWHYPIVWRFLPTVESYLPFHLPEPARFALYAGASLCMGIVMTHWVEEPALRLREKLFPKRRLPQPEPRALVGA